MWFPKRWLTNDKGLARDLNHVIFWNHVVVTCVPFTCIGWPQMTWFFELQIFGGFQNLIDWCQIVPDFIPGAIFGKNVEKIIKSHVPETGIRPKDEEKHENDANSEVDFRMSRLFRFIPFIRLQGHVRSREPLLTLFHVIDVGFNFGNVQFLHFWEKSLKMKLKNYKTELNSLRRGLIRSRTFKTPKMDLFGSFETIRVCSKNSGNSKNLEIGKIIQNDSMRLANSSLFFMVKYTRGSSHLSSKYKKYLTEVGFEPTPPKRLEP